MSRRNKLQKFAELLTFPNVYENFLHEDQSLTGVNGEMLKLAGKWNELHFKNQQPITLELACGYGEYTVDLAERYPERNFLGVDIKGNRIWQGARRALQAGLTNAAFLRTRIEQIEQFFAPDEIAEIWITFPDPFLRKSKSNRRLTSAPFLARYRKILQKKGIVHLKTDETVLYEFTLETLENDPQCEILHQTADIYGDSLLMPELAIPTRYEKIHAAKGKSMKYVQFTIH